MFDIPTPFNNPSFLRQGGVEVRTCPRIADELRAGRGGARADGCALGAAPGTRSRRRADALPSRSRRGTVGVVMRKRNRDTSPSRRPTRPARRPAHPATQERGRPPPVAVDDDAIILYGWHTVKA